VTFTNQALQAIDDFVASGKLEFYKSSAEVRAMIEQVLGMRACASQCLDAGVSVPRLL
jgi:hypothetical protein